MDEVSNGCIFGGGDLNVALPELPSFMQEGNMLFVVKVSLSRVREAANPVFFGPGITTDVEVFSSSPGTHGFGILMSIYMEGKVLDGG